MGPELISELLNYELVMKKQKEELYSVQCTLYSPNCTVEFVHFFHLERKKSFFLQQKLIHNQELCKTVFVPVCVCVFEWMGKILEMNAF